MPDNKSSYIKPYENANELSNLTLGKITSYISEYTPSLLQGVPRSLNRDGLHINPLKLPFIGEDVWYGYEISWLNLQGKPIVAVGEFRFACESENIIESKSFKLYLNSFNQSRFASKEDVIKHMVTDLSAISGKPATVELFNVTHCPALDINYLNAHCIDDINISINDYHFNSDLLTFNVNANTLNTNDLSDNMPNNMSDNLSDNASGELPNKKPAIKEITSEALVSHLLKSNCLITNQPDWATIYITYKGENISHENLLRYLISFRQHNEFHEQCVERIFNDLLNTFSLTELTVYARYTRRGGLDINPFRSNKTVKAPSARTHRQ